MAEEKNMPANGLRKNVTLTITTDSIAVMLLVMFYSMPFVRWIFDNVFGFVGLESLSRVALLFVMYSLCFFLFVIDRRYITYDFFVLLIIIVLFFLLTYLMHPEYEYVYTRDYYGVLPYVLRPDNGIYAYLFVRIVKKPNELMKGLTRSSYLMMVYSAIALAFALKRGYWIGENHLGVLTHYSYDLNFGYNLLLPVCTFLFKGLHEKDVKSLGFAAIGVIMIFIGGARGPFLGIILFCALYILMETSSSRHKVRNIMLVVFIGGLFFVYYRAIFTMLGDTLASFGISSRTITKLLEGGISEDNGRYLIWANAINHIKAHPFGSGAMGARNALYQIHYVGHPHNLFLELLIDYGVILGPIIIVVMIVGSLRIMFAKRYSQWKWVYLLFFAQACSLLTSYTYWHSNGIWGALAVAVCAYKATKNNQGEAVNQW